MKLTSKITGLDGFEERLIAFAEFPGLDAEALRLALDAKEEAAAQLAQNDVAFAERSRITVSLEIEQDRLAGTVTLGTDLPRAAELEFGAVKTPSSPWFGPAVATLERQIVSRFRAVLAAINRASPGRIKNRHKVVRS